MTSTFHRYVRPVAHPVLSDFCTELTGISQFLVADEDPFHAVYADFLEWLSEQGLTGEKKKSFAFVTCGDWDLKTMLPAQCELSRVERPEETFGQWINIKKSFLKNKGRKKCCTYAFNTLLQMQPFSGTYPRHIVAMLNGFGLEFDGRQHSGIDDCKNIHRIAKELAKNGHVFEYTQKRQ